MMHLTLQDFRVTTNGRAVNGHRFVQGFVPPYVDMATENNDAKFQEKVYPQYPLVVSPGITSVASHRSQYPVLMLPNESDTLGDILYSTNLWRFFSTDGTSLGIPSGTPSSNVGIDAIIYNGKLLTSHPMNTRLYHGAISSSPSWTASTGTELTSGNLHILKHFDTVVHCTNASSGAFTRSDQILIVHEDFSVTVGLTLGDTWHIKGLENYRDRYELIFCEKTTTPRLTPYTTVFMWDGIATSAYEQKFTLEGMYVTSIVKDTIPYVFTKLGTTLVCYYFLGDMFIELGRIKNTTVKGVSTIPKTKVSIDNDYFVLIASSPDVTSKDVPLYWKPSTGEAFYLTAPILNKNFDTLAIAQKPSDTHKRYFSFNDSPNSQIVSATLESTTTSVVTDNNPFENGTQFETVRADFRTRIAQSFTSRGGKLIKASFQLKKFGSPTGIVTAKLWSHIGTFGGNSEPGTLLASSTNGVNVAALSTSPEVFDFSFTGYQLVDGANYFIGLEYDGGDSSNNLQVGESTSNKHNGRIVGYNDNNGTWELVGSTTDLVFSVTETLPTTHSYKSNVIPAPIFSKDIHRDAPFGRMEIKKIVIEYNYKPPSVDDAIAVSLTTKDGFETETYTTTTATIKNTTANSTKAQVATKRAILNLGAKCTEFSIDLTVTKTTASWDLVVRRIIIYYEPIAVQM